MSVSVAIPNVAKKLGEGPHWEDDKQNLVFVDSLECKVYRWSPETEELDSVQLGKTIGSVVPCEKGGYLLGLGRTISHLEWDTGVVTSLHEVDTVGTNDRFNDGKCDPAGRFWTGTMGEQTDKLDVQQGVGCLYSLDTAGTLVKHLDKITVSNGLAWSADHQTMFYIDSLTRKVEAFDFDITTGQIKNRRTAVDFTSFPDTDTMGWPDGMTIDQQGHLWVACYGVGKVICFDSGTGKKLTEVKLPAPNTTSCCFGSKNLDDLYVTSAPLWATEEELNMYPLYGSVFKVTGLGAKGVPSNVYKG